MINRALIRLKVVQLVYSYYKKGDDNLDAALSELQTSLSKAYELYLYLLHTLVSLQRYAERKSEAEQARAERLNLTLDDEQPDRHLAANKLLLQLRDNEVLCQFAEKHGEWEEEPSFVKSLYDQFVGHQAFLEYVAMGDHSYEADREIVRRLYKSVICQNDTFDQLLEDHSLYWNDDKEIVDSFVLKTIRRYRSDAGPDEPLLPQYDSQEDQAFGEQLFRAAVEHEAETRQLISDNCRNWDFNRMAFMDIVIAQIALAEITQFADIPLNVSFSEYIDIAKIYSTPKSAHYLNGLLDHIVKRLKADGKLFK